MASLEWAAEKDNTCYGKAYVAEMSGRSSRYKCLRLLIEVINACGLGRLYLLNNNAPKTMSYEYYRPLTLLLVGNTLVIKL